MGKHWSSLECIAKTSAYTVTAMYCILKGIKIERQNKKKEEEDEDQLWKYLSATEIAAGFLHMVLNMMTFFFFNLSVAPLPKRNSGFSTQW